jgi:2-polyprenyl-3-methyl-5-hydroxy-6-metoxy-1,4-benzoquinol methylase
MASGAETRIIEQGGATTVVEELGEGRRRITVTPNRPDYYVARQSWVTRYPVALIEKIHGLKGAGHVCEEIMREEDPEYTRRQIETVVRCFLPPDKFDGVRVLDFGCGLGASLCNLYALFGPATEFVGLELNEPLLQVARARAEFYGYERIRLIHSAVPDGVPEGLGEFDIVMLNAVFEHLLPDERKHLMPKLWALLKPGGILLVRETPHRYFPIEVHTTSLPLLNYLPHGLALALIRAVKPRAYASTSWSQLLREGVRGATPSEILSSLGAPRGSYERLHSREPKLKDMIDLWAQGESFARNAGKKRLTLVAARLLKGVTGIDLAPWIAMAVRKLPA